MHMAELNCTLLCQGFKIECRVLMPTTHHVSHTTVVNSRQIRFCQGSAMNIVPSIWITHEEECFFKQSIQPHCVPNFLELHVSTVGMYVDGCTLCEWLERSCFDRPMQSLEHRASFGNSNRRTDILMSIVTQRAVCGDLPSN